MQIRMGLQGAKQMVCDLSQMLYKSQFKRGGIRMKICPQCKVIIEKEAWMRESRFRTENHWQRLIFCSDKCRFKFKMNIDEEKNGTN